MMAIKKGANGSNGLYAPTLNGISSFDKQAREIEYSDFMAREYFIDDANKMSKSVKGTPQLSESLVEVKKQTKGEISNDISGKSAPNEAGYMTIRENDGLKFYWDTVILILALFNSITIPLTIFFEDINTDFSSSEAYNIVNIVATAFFFLDILFQMNTTYYNSDGDEIYDKKKIIKNYLTGMFIIDFLSSLPMEYITIEGWEALRLINILKIIRVKKLTGIINKMNVDEEIKSRFRMFYLVFQLLLVMHIVGSFWYFICAANTLWIPPLDFVYAGKYP